MILEQRWRPGVGSFFLRPPSQAPTMFSKLPKAATCEQLLARQPTRIIRSQENRDRSDIARLPKPTQRRLAHRDRGEIRLCESGAFGAFRHDHAGIDRIDADLPRAELAR